MRLSHGAFRATNRLPTPISVRQSTRIVSLTRHLTPSRTEVRHTMSRFQYPKRHEIKDIFKGVETGDLSGFLGRVAEDVEWTVMGTKRTETPATWMDVEGDEVLSEFSTFWFAD